MVVAALGAVFSPFVPGQRKPAIGPDRAEDIRDNRQDRIALVSKTTPSLLFMPEAKELLGKAACVELVVHRSPRLITDPSPRSKSSLSKLNVLGYPIAAGAEPLVK